MFGMRDTPLKRRQPKQPERSRGQYVTVTRPDLPLLCSKIATYLNAPALAQKKNHRHIHVVNAPIMCIYADLTCELSDVLSWLMSDFR
jgi:hypothetical protein